MLIWLLRQTRGTSFHDREFQSTPTGLSVGRPKDFAAADREFRRAVELNPGYATAHHCFAWHLSLAGRNKEAIAEITPPPKVDAMQKAAFIKTASQERAAMQLFL